MLKRSEREGRRQQSKKIITTKTTTNRRRDHKRCDNMHAQFAYIVVFAFDTISLLFKFGLKAKQIIIETHHKDANLFVNEVFSMFFIECVPK